MSYHPRVQKNWCFYKVCFSVKNIGHCGQSLGNFLMIEWFSGAADFRHELSFLRDNWAELDLAKIQTERYCLEFFSHST